MGRDVPYEMAYVEGTLMDDYLHDVEIATSHVIKITMLIITRKNTTISREPKATSNRLIGKDGLNH